MAIEHAQAGEVIDVSPHGAAIGEHRTRTLIKSDGLEVIRLVLPAGKDIATHKAPGAMTLQCLEGKVGFAAMGKEQTLEAGQLLYLEASVPHSVRSIDASSLLLTIRLAGH